MRKLLLNHPRLCSFGIVTHDHPDDGVMDGMRFQYEMIGEGWDREVGSDEKSPTNRKVVGRVSVSDIAYLICTYLVMLPDVLSSFFLIFLSK